MFLRAVLSEQAVFAVCRRGPSPELLSTRFFGITCLSDRFSWIVINDDSAPARSGGIRDETYNIGVARVSNLI
jgi:hypothetical protein